MRRTQEYSLTFAANIFATTRGIFSFRLSTASYVSRTLGNHTAAPPVSIGCWKHTRCSTGGSCRMYTNKMEEDQGLVIIMYIYLPTQCSMNLRVTKWPVLLNVNSFCKRLATKSHQGPLCEYKQTSFGSERS